MKLWHLLIGIIVILLLLPVIYAIVFLSLWKNAENELEKSLSRRESVQKDLRQQLAALPVFPSSVVLQVKKSFASEFVPFRTVDTAIATLFYKADPKFSPSDASNFYREQLIKSGWKLEQGIFVLRGLQLQASASCASDNVKDSDLEPNRNCSELKGGYLKIHLLLSCEASKPKECR